MTIYQILLDDKVIIPIDIGTHDRVYWIWMELDELLDFGKFKIQDATPLPHDPPARRCVKGKPDPFAFVDSVARLNHNRAGAKCAPQGRVAERRDYAGRFVKGRPLLPMTSFGNCFF